MGVILVGRFLFGSATDAMLEVAVASPELKTPIMFCDHILHLLIHPPNCGHGLGKLRHQCPVGGGKDGIFLRQEVHLMSLVLHESCNAFQEINGFVVIFRRGRQWHYVEILYHRRVITPPPLSLCCHHAVVLGARGKNHLYATHATRNRSEERVLRT